MNPLRLIPLLLVPLQAAAQIATLPPNGVGTILGRHVFSTAQEDIGLLTDILVDTNGAPTAAIIDVGGFLGVGTRRIAIAWNLLHFSFNGDDTRIVEDLSHDEAAAAPEYPCPLIVTGPTSKP